MQAIDLNDEQVELRQIGSHEGGQLFRRQGGTDAAPPISTRRCQSSNWPSTFGSRAARPNRRVETLISIRSIAPNLRSGCKAKPLNTWP